MKYNLENFKDIKDGIWTFKAGFIIAKNGDRFGLRVHISWINENKNVEDYSKFNHLINYINNEMSKTHDIDILSLDFNLKSKGLILAFYSFKNGSKRIIQDDDKINDWLEIIEEVYKDSLYNGLTLMKITPGVFVK